MHPGLVSIAAGGLAICGFVAVYVISATGGQVEVCVPYLHGCTSISRAGRQIPAIYVYRGTIAPSAVLMLVYWWLTYRWLVAVGFGNSGLSKFIGGLGIAASVSLVAFAMCLGSTDETLKIVRRFGAAFFFAGTGLAQVLLTERIVRLSKEWPGSVAPGVLIAKATICAALFIYCFANFLAGYYDRDAVQNIIEWQAATLMAAYFMLTGSVWRTSRFLAEPSQADGAL